MRRPLNRWTVLLTVAILTGLGVLAIKARNSAPPPQPVANEAFTSPANDQAPATVWAVGDGGDGGSAAKQLARRIAAEQPDRVMYLGDVYESGTAAEFRENFSTVYGPLASRIAPTPGNHDWPRHETGYDPYWARVTGAPPPPWYRLRIAGWDLISLNSEAPHEERSEQLRWLRSQLEKPGTCRLAFWHRPLYSAGSHGDQDDVAPFWDALRGHATVVLNGHDHNVQRFRPVGGITELIAGAGGHSRYELDPDDPRLAFADDDVEGAMRVRLRPGAADLDFVRSDGRILDRSSVACTA